MSARARPSLAGARIAVLAVAVCSALAGCAIAPPVSPRPTQSLPADFGPGSSAGDPAAASAVPPRWWTLYRDPALDGLVDAALAGNADVRLAVAQLEEAEGVLREAGANLSPQIDLGATGSRSRITGLGAQPVPAGIPLARSDRRLAASTSFELDFWGRLRNALDVARAQTLSSRYAADVVRLSLAGAVVQAYVGVRSLDAQLGIARRTLALRDESLQVVGARARGGLASDLDLRQAESARADAASQLIELQRQRAALEHLVGSLSGRPGLTLAAGGLDGLPVPPMPPTGLPSALIERRPDLQVAEQALVAADGRVAIARAAMFPTISLTGSYGGQSADLGDLLRAGARIWSLGFGLTLPIFDAGRVQARIEQTEARQRQALAGYQKTLETAFREVADALSNVQAAAAAETELGARARAADQALRLAQMRYQAGYSAYLEVIDAQRTANDAALAQVRGRQSTLAYSVDLMKSLGGGWSAAAANAR